VLGRHRCGPVGPSDADAPKKPTMVPNRQPWKPKKTFYPLSKSHAATHSSMRAAPLTVPMHLETESEVIV
jgi:hypothetical protein